MKFIFAWFLLICTLASVLGSDCNIEGKSLNAGDKYSPPGSCLNYICGKDGSYSALGCPAVAAGPECKLVPQDNSKPYPQCCETYEC